MRKILVVAMFLLGAALGAYVSLATQLGTVLGRVYGTVWLVFVALKLPFISPPVIAAIVSLLLLIILFGLLAGVTQAFRSESRGAFGSLVLVFFVTTFIATLAFAGLRDIPLISDWLANAKTAPFHAAGPRA
jgi:hypothetical protein